MPLGPRDPCPVSSAPMRDAATAVAGSAGSQQRVREAVELDGVHPHVRHGVCYPPGSVSTT
jgi:hypothetical protein